jgi:hypothetical protein
MRLQLARVLVASGYHNRLAGQIKLDSIPRQSTCLQVDLALLMQNYMFQLQRFTLLQALH